MMQEEMKEEGRNNGTTGKAKRWTERLRTKKRFIKKPSERRKGKHHST